MEPTFSGGDDNIGIGAPDEGLGLGLVVFGDEAVDGGLQVDHAGEDAVLQSSARELGEEALDSVESRTGSRGEVEGPARMPCEPAPDLGRLVRGDVVEDDVNDPARRDVALQRVQEPDELLMAVTRHVLPEDLAGQDVDRGEQRCGSVAFVVVRHGGAAAPLQRQAGLGAVEGWIWLFSSIDSTTAWAGGAT